MVGVLKYISILIFVIYSVFSFADDMKLLENGVKDPKDAYRILKAAYKEQRKILKEKKKNNQNDNGVIQLETCIECNKINPLINEVNQVLKVMIDTKQVDPNVVGAVEQIEKLEAMYIIAQDHESQVLKPENEDGCQIIPGEVFLKDPLKQRIPEDQLTQIMSFNIPLSKMESIHIRNPKEKSRTYYYRAAKPNENIIIRVHIPNSGQPTVQYLYKGDMNDIKLRIEMKENARKIKEEILGDKKEEDNYWGGLAKFEGENSTWEAGVAIEHKNNLPRRIVLLRGSDKTEIFENTYLNTEVEVTDRKQEIRMGLSDEVTQYFNVKLKANGKYYAEVPFELSTDYLSITDGAIATSEDEDELRAGIKFGNTHLFHLSGVSNRENGDSSISVNKNIFDPKTGGMVSFEFKDEKIQGARERSVWIRYTLDF